VETNDVVCVHGNRLQYLSAPYDFSAIQYRCKRALRLRSERSDHRLLPTLNVARMYNSYVQAGLLFLSLIMSLYSVALLCNLVGNLQVDDGIFDQQPLLHSTSPSDFWGNRWNNLNQTVTMLSIIEVSRCRLV
jgi:hypothetical protein